MSRGYTVAIYLRISDEDREGEELFRESRSISGQRIVLRDFIENHEELHGSNIIEVIDDGYSGTNFERPGIKSLFRKSKEQSVNCIVVKDFSRFGRNYLEVGNYLEQIFPFLGIRFISVNDNFDSFKNFGAAGAIDVGFKNIVYEAYSKDLSVKIRSARKSKAEQGKFVTAFAPYGYVKDKNNKNHLIIEEECAAIVRLIYELFLQGTNKTEISRILNRENIPSPMMIREKRNEKFERCECHNPSNWTVSTISRILFDQRYTGDGVYGKVTPKAVGSKKEVAVPKEKWIVVPNAHAGIIEREMFNRVEATRRTYRYQCKNKVDYPQNLNSTMQNAVNPPGEQESSTNSIAFKMKKVQESRRKKETGSLKLYESWKAHKITEAQFLKQMKSIEADLVTLNEQWKQ